LRHTPGIIALVALVCERVLGTVYVPAMDAREATLRGGVRVMTVPTLGALVAHLRGAGSDRNYQLLQCRAVRATTKEGRSWGDQC
jgi:predicted ATPase with chaperone activity